MDKTELLEIFTRQQRIEVEYPGIQREVEGSVVRHINLAGKTGFVIYSRLDEENVEAAISAQIARFQRILQDFEWKAYDYDPPPDLIDRLRRRGFEIGEPEALLVLDLAAAPEALGRPLPPSVVRITDPGEVEAVVALEDAVWGTDHRYLGEMLKRDLQENPEILSIYLSYQGQQPASVAWIYFHPGSRFASLWGGSTLPQFRSQGHYTRLLAARAQEALARGFTLLTVDASPLSRPILEKFGFQTLGASTPCKWSFHQEGQAMQSSENPIDIDSLWEYADPALSEARFRTALDSAQGDARLELLTQIARTYSLQGQFAAAHQALDEVEAQLDTAGARPRVRTLLERGRSFNSSGEVEKARPLFMDAWEQARAAQLEGLAVDAAHMVAITCSGTPEAVTWNQQGLAIARGSKDPKAAALIPAMLNNSAWDLHELGRFDEALALFEEAQAAWTARGKPQQIRIAKWSVGRCTRSLGRYAEALAIQRLLEAEYEAAGSADGYVFEEIAENLAALGQTHAARPYFEKAHAELSQDKWFVKHEAARLASLQARASNEE